MISIVPMAEDHLDGVFEVEKSSFSIPWTYESLRDEIKKNSNAHYFAAVDGSNKVLGYCGLWHIVNEGHITNVAVAPEYRRKGIGAKLVQKLIGLAHEKKMIGLTLEVRVNNAAAQGLYFKHGFKVEGIRKGYYSDTKEDAVIMWLEFEKNEL
jgi:ribosomal-protein-alanine N-acetyltransferase